MTESAFARAAQQAAPAAPQQSLTDPMTGNTEGYDPMFGGKSMPSLFVRSHTPGTELTGIITDVPFRKHSREYNRDGSLGALKYWGDDNRPTSEPTDRHGQPRRPVMDEVVPLQTEYRDRGTDRFEDKGERAFYAGNKYATNALYAAVRNSGISSREQLKGMRFTVTRSGTEGKWGYDISITAA